MLMLINKLCDIIKISIVMIVLFSCTQRTSQNLGAGYNAPECTKPSAYTLKSDVYSFGVVMLELFTGRMPLDR